MKNLFGLSLLLAVILGSTVVRANSNDEIGLESVRSRCLGALCLGDFVVTRNAGAGTVIDFADYQQVVLRGLDGRSYFFNQNDVTSPRITYRGVRAGRYVGIRLSGGFGASAGFGQVLGLFPNLDVGMRGLNGRYYVFSSSQAADPTVCAANGVCPGHRINIRNGGYGTLVGTLSDLGIVTRGVDGRYYSFNRDDY